MCVPSLQVYIQTLQEEKFKKSVFTWTTKFFKMCQMWFFIGCFFSHTSADTWKHLCAHRKSNFHKSASSRLICEIVISLQANQPPIFYLSKSDVQDICPECARGMDAPPVEHTFTYLVFFFWFSITKNLRFDYFHHYDTTRIKQHCSKRSSLLLFFLLNNSAHIEPQWFNFNVPSCTFAD